MKFLITTLALLGWTAVLGTIEKPSIILIYADDLGYGDIGCFGQKKIQLVIKIRISGIIVGEYNKWEAVCSQ